MVTLKSATESGLLKWLILAQYYHSGIFTALSPATRQQNQVLRKEKYYAAPSEATPNFDTVDLSERWTHQRRL